MFGVLSPDFPHSARLGVQNPVQRFLDHHLHHFVQNAPDARFVNRHRSLNHPLRPTQPANERPASMPGDSSALEGPYSCDIHANALRIRR